MSVEPLNLSYAEGLYESWRRDPSSVPAAWSEYFGRQEHRGDRAEVARLQDRADRLVHAFRSLGYTVADVDPLGRKPGAPPELDPSHYGLDEDDLDRPVSAATVPGRDRLPLRDLIERLRETYCRSIGVQYMHIEDPRLRGWLQERMEESRNRLNLDEKRSRRILERLAQAVTFEEFVQKKYLGAKTFSLEGSESLVPLLELVIETAAELGIAELVIGMAHRGRLNVLASIAGKAPRAIFAGLEDPEPEDDEPRAGARGDVQYHLGHSADWESASGRTLHLSLCFNPSHLGFVTPIVCGRVRAKQDRAGDGRGRKGMGLVLHGDAAFSGEGIVPETLNLSRLSAYETAGTLHVVVDNGIGFTTPPEQARSAAEPTDVAKMLDSPIFHVNGEDLEAVAQVVRLALGFRMEFGRDVFVDLHGFRRRGHNEADEPAFTQPVLYREIRKRAPAWRAFLERLPESAGLDRGSAEAIAQRYREMLEEELEHARAGRGLRAQKPLAGIWEGYTGGPEPDPDADPDTGVAEETLSRLLRALSEVPDGFHPHPKIERVLDARRRAAGGEEPLDWAMGEALAFATLSVEGHPIRLTGQDSERGTFSHRHAVLHDVEDGRRHTPLAHLAKDQAPVLVRNSPLSEAAVLGFEYGYSLDYPEALVCWEAQFGDFVNAAQVFVDQFIAAAETKWGRLSGLVLLLPHGLEGQGPEHSSARLERFLELAAEDNLRIAQPTTPAQLFHLLRRHVLGTWRKPLVVLTPKSLLRRREAVSRLADLARGRFRRFIGGDREALRRASRVLLCSGKIAYDLEAARRERERGDVAVVRVEQLYPLRDESLEEVLAPVRDGTPVVWVQEEPENMGAWRTLRARFGEELVGRLPFEGIARPECASPAAGSRARHEAEQRRLVARALGDGEDG